MLWALLLGFLVFGEVPSVLVFVGAGIIAGAGLFVIWRERQLGLQRARAAEGAADRDRDQRPNALKVMIVRVSWMPGMVCTFSLTKWPMSVPSST